MKLILTQEVDGLGTPGDIVDVKDGYGRNFLLPRGLATGWTKGAEKQVDPVKRARETREIRDHEHRRAGPSARLEATTVSIKARTGENGRLFGAVTVGDVVDAIVAAGGPPGGQAQGPDRQPDQDRRLAQRDGPPAHRLARQGHGRGRRFLTRPTGPPGGGPVAQVARRPFAPCWTSTFTGVCTTTRRDGAAICVHTPVNPARACKRR